MHQNSASLARKITWKSSKQSFFTALLLVDRPLVNDCFRAYAYFRWVDDQIDNEPSYHHRHAFSLRQSKLIKSLYRGEQPIDITVEESLLVDLINHDRQSNSKLRSFIDNFFAIIAFDGERKGKPISVRQLTWYEQTLGRAVTDAIQYFIGNHDNYPENPDRCQGAIAAHITHMLRDLRGDVSSGYINIPSETLTEYQFQPVDYGHKTYRSWIQQRTIQARLGFRQNKAYIDQMQNLRCKIAATWYTARFETILDMIEADDYYLRDDYSEHKNLSNWVRMGKIAIKILLHHTLKESVDSSTPCPTQTSNQIPSLINTLDRTSNAPK